jgi:hypothetical protein
MRTARLDGKEEVFVFEDHAHLIEFLEWQKECVALDVGNLIRAAIPYDRWDHYYGTCMRTIHSMALIKIRSAMEKADGKLDEAVSALEEAISSLEEAKE